MEPALVTGGLAAVTGVGVMASAAIATRRAAIEAVDYVRGLDDLGNVPDAVFDPQMDEPLLSRLLRPAAARVLQVIAMVTPANHRQRIHHELQLSGLAAAYRPEEIIAAEVALGLFGLFAGLVVVGFQLVTPALGLTLLLLLPVIGAIAPRTLLHRKVTERRGAVLSDLPDTLDLLAISVEAGVGLEGAMRVVCDRFDSPLAEEFSHTLKEMELGLTRKDALHNLKNRTDVPELSAFVSALIQADTLGMSVGRILKVQAGEMRMKRRQWARERAARLPVKIIFPLVMCIFPAVLVVVLAPAASQIGQALK